MRSLDAIDNRESWVGSRATSVLISCEMDQKDEEQKKYEATYL